MPWVEVFAVFVVSHAAGDFLLQTEWQATRKRHGAAPRREQLRALLTHVASYTLCFVPALVWLADDVGAGGAVALGAALALTHGAQDDARALGWYVRRVKHTEPRPGEALFVMVDQTLHLLVLFLAAVIVGHG